MGLTKGVTLTVPGSHSLLRIYFNEDDACEGRSLAEALMDEVKKEGFHGATILRGVMGFGSHGKVHSATLVRLTESLPLVLEIIDEAGRMRDLAERLEPCLKGCLVTLMPVEVLHYGGNL